MEVELIVTDKIKDYSSEAQKDGIFAAVDRFIKADFGELDTLPQDKKKAIKRSFDKCAETAIGIYRVKGIAGAIIIIFDARFSNRLKEIYHYKKDSLIILMETEFPYNSPDPIKEVTEALAKNEVNRKRSLN